MDQLIETLTNCGVEIKKDKYEINAYVLTFSRLEAVTTIRILFRDYCGADLVITNMTTLPGTARGQGFGTIALQELLTCARDLDLVDIRAVQVQKLSENFWTKNNFARIPEPNDCNDFQLLDRYSH